MATGSEPPKTTSARPASAMAARTRTVGTRPRRSSSRGAVPAPDGHRGEEDREGERAQRGRRAVAVDHRDAEPVVAGALGERGREDEQADEQRAGLRPGLERAAARLVVLAARAAGRARKPRTASGTDDGDRRSPPRAGARSRRRRAPPCARPRARRPPCPTLKPAWKRGMIARPSPRSTAVPSTFMATSQVPMPRPRTNSPIDHRQHVAARARPRPSPGRPRRCRPSRRPSAPSRAAR